MRLLEKIMLGFIALVLISRFSPDILPNTKHEFTNLAFYLLALIYFFGGFWLLRNKEKTQIILPVLAGIAFSAALIVLPRLLRVTRQGLEPYFILPNLAFMLGIGIYMLFKKKSKPLFTYLKGLFTRSLVIGCLCVFLTYTPVTNVVYRDFISFFNNGDEQLLDNLKMVQYVEMYKKARASGDCDKELEYAQTANTYGKLWLGSDTLIGYSEKKTPDSLRNIPHDAFPSLGSSYWLSVREKYRYISGTFEFLYFAYRCKADNYFDLHNMDSSLKYYTKAYKAEFIGAYDTNEWLRYKAFLERDMATSYTNLKNYKVADSLYAAAIKDYTIVPYKNDSILADLFTVWGESFHTQKLYTYSNTAILNAVSILNHDSLKNKSVLIYNYFMYAKNYLSLNHLDTCYYYLNTILKERHQNPHVACEANLYYGMYHYKMDHYKIADSAVHQFIDCYKTIDSTAPDMCLAYYSLSYINIALGNFNIAKGHNDNALRILNKVYSGNSETPRFILTSGFIDKILGDYAGAENKYLDVKNSANLSPVVIPELYSNLAELYVVIEKDKDALELADYVLSYEKPVLQENALGSVDFINTIAYVYYCTGKYVAADTLYQKSIKICRTAKKDSSSFMALALNGCGLLQTALNNYKKADSLFQQSIVLHLKIFGENSPFTAQVYINYGILKTYETDLSKASDLLNKALNIDTKFYDSSHDIFGDIYSALGDLSVKEMNPAKAKNYYQLALNIYSKKFGETHRKTLLVKQKLGRV
jgi:hypothetical protein